MNRAILFIGIAAAALGVAQPQPAAAPRHAPASHAKGDQGGHKYLVPTHAKRHHHGCRLRKHRHCIYRHRRPYHTGYRHIRFSNGGSFAVVLSLGDTPYGYARPIRHRTRYCYIQSARFLSSPEVRPKTEG